MSYVLCFVHVLCLKYLLNVMYCGYVNSFPFHLNYAKHKQWSWFGALACMNSKFNVQIIEIRYGHATFEHGRAWLKRPQIPKVGIRHDRATFEYSRATWLWANKLKSGTAMPFYGMTVHVVKCLRFYNLEPGTTVPPGSVKNCPKQARQCHFHARSCHLMVTHLRIFPSFMH